MFKVKLSPKMVQTYLYNNLFNNHKRYYNNL